MKWLEASHVRHVDPRTLRRHPENERWCRPHTTEEHNALKKSIASSGGISDPIKICGAGCSSPPGTLLDGHERTSIAVELGMELVATIVLNNLTERDERQALVMGNFAKTQGRRLTEREIAHLEKNLLDLHKLGRGARTDKTGAGRGPTLKYIAALQNERVSKVKDRQTAFFNPLSTPELQRAVDAKQIPRSIAARKIRKTASCIARGEVSQGEAFKEIDGWVATRIASPPKRGRPRGNKNKTTVTQTKTAPPKLASKEASSTPLHVRLREAGTMLDRSVRAILEVTLDVLDDVAASASAGVWDASNAERLAHIVTKTINVAQDLGRGPKDLVATLAGVLPEEVRS